jgi:hypothetical protein
MKLVAVLTGSVAAFGIYPIDLKVFIAHGVS